MVRYLALTGIEVALGVMLLGAFPVDALAQTPFVGGLDVRLLPGYRHEPLQGIDSIVGKIVKEGVPEIMYEMGRNPAPGAPRLGGDYSNSAMRLPEINRRWLKEQTIGSRQYHIAYSKEDRLIVSTTFGANGINFTTQARTPEEIADVLLIVFSIREPNPKRER